jgi:RNA polymerase sigma-70 factor (sigma-E family)
VAQGFDVYARSIRTWLRWEAYRLCGDWHEAEDLVQITLIKIYRRWEHLDGRELLGGYTHRTLVHTYISERRRPRWSHEVVGANLPDPAVPGPGPRETDDGLWEAIGHLAARQRAVIMLRFWADLSIEQTAAALGCTPGTITSQTHRALVHLRATLAGSGPGDPGPRTGTRLDPARPGR